MHAPAKCRRLLDAYGFAGLIPRDDIRDIFGDPLARVRLCVLNNELRLRALPTLLRMTRPQCDPWFDGKPRRWAV